MPCLQEQEADAPCIEIGSRKNSFHPDNHASHRGSIVCKVGRFGSSILTGSHHKNLTIVEIEHQFSEPVFFVHTVECEIQRGHLHEKFADDVSLCVANLGSKKWNGTIGVGFEIGVRVGREIWTILGKSKGSD